MSSLGTRLAAKRSARDAWTAPAAGTTGTIKKIEALNGIGPPGIEIQAKPRVSRGDSASREASQTLPTDFFWPKLAEAESRQYERAVSSAPRLERRCFANSLRHRGRVRWQSLAGRHCSPRLHVRAVVAPRDRFQ